MQRVTSGQIGAVDLGTVTGEGKAMEERSLENPGAGAHDYSDGPPVEPTVSEELDMHPDAVYGRQYVAQAQERETVRRRGNTAEYDIDPTLNWLLMRAGDEWGPLGVAKAAAFLAGHHVMPGFVPREDEKEPKNG